MDFDCGMWVRLKACSAPKITHTELTNASARANGEAYGHCTSASRRHSPIHGNTYHGTEPAGNTRDFKLFDQKAGTHDILNHETIVALRYTTLVTHRDLVIVGSVGQPVVQHLRTFSRRLCHVGASMCVHVCTGGTHAHVSLSTMQAPPPPPHTHTWCHLGKKPVSSNAAMCWGGSTSCHAITALNGAMSCGGAGRGGSAVSHLNGRVWKSGNLATLAPAPRLNTTMHHS